MFIETLEFTIPVDLCDLFSTLKRGPRSNLEFPASVNSYGTTQDANIQVALRSNKLTFKVDGVSSNASMISKSECKTLKLSVFDVDCSLAPAEQNITMSVSENTHSVSHKRSYDFSVPVSSPAPKSRRISEPVQSRHIPQPENTSRPSNNSQSKSAVDPPVNVKQEPEDPDLIEIEPDSELNDIEPKKETPYMQIDFSSGVPHTQTSQAALDRLSHPQSSHSQSPASSSSSFHQNVPHVPDYAEPSTSQVHHGDQSADDFLVFQDDNDYGDDNDNEADYSNDDWEDVTEGSKGNSRKGKSSKCRKSSAPKSAVGGGVHCSGQGKASHATLSPTHLLERDGRRKSEGSHTRHDLSSSDHQNRPESVEKETCDSASIPDMPGSPHSSVEDYDTIEVLNISKEGKSKKVFVYTKSATSCSPEPVTFDPFLSSKSYSTSEHAYAYNKRDKNSVSRSSERVKFEPLRTAKSCSASEQSYAYSKGDCGTDQKHQTVTRLKDDMPPTTKPVQDNPPKVLSIIVSGEVMFSCSVCGHVSPKISEIDQHIMAAHNKIPDQQQSGSSSSIESCYRYSKSRGWWCLVCSHVEHNHHSMVRHVQCVHFGKASDAAVVQTTYSTTTTKESSSSLKKSPVVKPPSKSCSKSKSVKEKTVPESPSDDPMRFNCDTCDYHTNKKSHFDRHNMSLMHFKLSSAPTNKTKPPKKKPNENSISQKCYRCPNCKYSCTSESKFNAHKLVHIDSSRKCMICKRAFYSKFHLQQHNNAKHPEKRKSSLAKTKSLTTGNEKPTSLSTKVSSPSKLICGICGETFTQKLHLENHVLTHLPKVHCCEFCNKRFAFRQAFMKHKQECTEKVAIDEPGIEIDNPEENSEIGEDGENTENDDLGQCEGTNNFVENLETENVEENLKAAGVKIAGQDHMPGSNELLDIHIKQEPSGAQDS
ncbi:uncharacterized protein [Haliotis asinina]|uniref:uncharacterized protein n=1 Tax=Haliotis asinina TaxID=109174 RepID=UPI0035323D95